MKKESILCSAIYINDNKIHEQQPENIEIGFVICGRRHNNCYQTIKDITSLSENQVIGELVSNLSDEELRKHQGFITSLDRFVTRQEAWIIAKENNQIQFGLNCSDEFLISENLY